jgi:CRP-like cAMP-binding protein
VRTTNQLLNRLAQVRPFLSGTAEEIPLRPGEILHANAGERVESVYFPHDGVISIRSNYPSGAQIEIASIGNDGAFGLFSLLGAPISPMVAEVTFESRATRLPLSEVRRIYCDSAPVRALVGGFLTTLFNQVVRSLGCYRFHTHDQWVARWLLVTADAAGLDTLPVTHDVIAQRIGSPRHAVSRTLADMREAGAIRSERGTITIVDRPRLESFSCDCHRAAARAAAVEVCGGVRDR